MHWHVEFDPADRFATVTTSGTFTVADHARMVQDILGHAAWVPGWPVLFDHRELDFGEQGYEAMARARDRHVENDDRIGPGRAAILVRPGADYGRARQFELLADGRVSADVRVFTDEAEARAWVREVAPPPSPR